MQCLHSPRVERMRHGRYHHGDLRAALLVQAESRLRERGVAGLSLRGYERLDRVTAAAMSAAGDTFAARLDAAARAYVDFAVADPELLALMFAAKHDVAPSPELAAAANGWF